MQLKPKLTWYQFLYPTGLNTSPHPITNALPFTLAQRYPAQPYNQLWRLFQVSTRRFFAYLGLACWLVLTPIGLWTGQQWIEQSTQSEIFSQQTRADGPDPRAVETFSIAEKRRQEFWHEFAAWIVLTIATSALLAEHRHDHFQHHPEHAHERLPDRVAERISHRG